MDGFIYATIMAKDKPSFILYSDIQSTIKLLTDHEAGQLFKHILSYVNDERPELTNLTLKLVFEPIKQSLKRDLKKYERIVERNHINGLKGGRPKKPKKPNGIKKTQTNPDEPKKADSVSVSVSDNGIDNDSDIIKRGVVFPFDSDKFKKTWLIWKKYKKDEFNFKYKGIESEQAAMMQLYNKSDQNEDQANLIIFNAIANGWKGFFKLNSEDKKQLNIDDDELSKIRRKYGL